MMCLEAWMFISTMTTPTSMDSLANILIFFYSSIFSIIILTLCLVIVSTCSCLLASGQTIRMDSLANILIFLSLPSSVYSVWRFVKWLSPRVHAFWYLISLSYFIFDIVLSWDLIYYHILLSSWYFSTLILVIKFTPDEMHLEQRWMLTCEWALSREPF